MGVKLYPPYIEGKLPAQIAPEKEQTNATLVFNFEMNRAVSASDIETLSAIIRAVATNSQVAVLSAKNHTITSSTGVATFEIEKSKLKIGQFYKLQLAYQHTDKTIGYYSTVGVFKYTATPRVEINELTSGQPNAPLGVYIGRYTPNSYDLSEKEYSYSFAFKELVDEDSTDNDIELYNTGTLIHNSALGYDEFVSPVHLDQSKLYRIYYTVNTMNGIETSIIYRIDPDKNASTVKIKGNLKVEMHPEDAYTQIKLKCNDNSLNGKYHLYRQTENSAIYDTIGTFDLSNSAAGDIITVYKDFTVEQGISYKYGIQKLDTSNNDVVASAILFSNEIIVDFEDMFLFDGERQLKLQFNPKISSFKTTLLESKLNTLGSRYPFFFRNGNVNYKEFSISALVSMLSDENELFMTWQEREDNNITTQSRTNLSALNMKRERDFKLAVLDWLNDGKPKLFRSAAEGNYLVRLMSVSLAPNDTLGRMLHTVSAQATEIMDSTHNTLVKNQFVYVGEPVSHRRYLATNAGEKLLEDSGYYLVFQEE